MAPVHPYAVLLLVPPFVLPYVLPRRTLPMALHVGHLVGPTCPRFPPFLT